jgi:hypothetical protein
VWLLQLGQAQDIGSFDDDDPHNDPNVCFTAADPANCDWNRGWFQAAVNMGHLSLQDAQNVYPDIQVGQTMNQNSADLYNDDDPENDPNLCNQSTDANCDWNRGWHDARATLVASNSIPSTEEPGSQDYGVRDGDRLIGDKIIRGTAPADWLTAIAHETVPPNVTEIRWLGSPTYVTDDPNIETVPGG